MDEEIQKGKAIKGRKMKNMRDLDVDGGGARVCRGGGMSTLTGAFKGMQPIGRREIEIRVSARKK